MYSKVLIFLTISALSCGAPNNHLKAVVVDNQAPSGNGVAYGSLGASASWGGYSAGAGLGGNAGGGGLFAGANAPEGSAGAGIGGSSSASASASAGAGVTGSGVGVSSGGHGQGGGFFDKIFNIPISILHSVNSHLNKQGKTVSVHGSGQAGGDAGSSATASANANAGVGVISGADTGAHAGGTVNVRKNYDSAFAIPIAALTSVNQFLNGK